MKENEQPVYTGWRKWTPTPEEWGEFYASSQSVPPFEMKENEYLLVYSEENGEPRLCQQYCYEKGKLRKFSRGSIAVSKKRDADSKVIYPRNDEQVCAFDLFRDDKKTVKLLTGTWGVGKSYIMINAALEALRHGRYERVIWIRNNIDVKDTKDLGALPGTVEEKLNPFLQVFADNAGEEEAETMANKGSLIVEPLQFLRGRNFENSIIMCSESEQFTKEHIQLIIARAAAGSAVWFDADVRQRDRAVFERSRGIETMIERLAGNPLFGYVHLVKSERSNTAALADLLN